MPNSLNAAKRHRQSLTARARNRTSRSRIRTQIKKFDTAIQAGDLKSARLCFAKFVKAIDTAVGKNIYHRNTAARKKSRLCHHLRTCSQADS